MQQANKTFSFLLLILIAVKNFGIIVFYSWGVSKPDGKGFLDFYIFLIIHFCSIVCLLIVTFQKIYIYIPIKRWEPTEEESTIVTETFLVVKVIIKNGWDSL